MGLTITGGTFRVPVPDIGLHILPLLHLTPRLLLLKNYKLGLFQLSPLSVTDRAARVRVGLFCQQVLGFFSVVGLEVLGVLLMLKVLDRSFLTNNCSLNDPRTHISNTVLWQSDICIECVWAFDNTCILPVKGDTGIDV